MRIPASSIAQSGLVAASTALEVSANNVANSLSSDFSPSKAEFSDVEGGGVTVSISNEAKAGAPPGTDLVEETANQSSAVAAYRANLKSLKTDDEVTGVLVNLNDHP
jgi:flagellar hook protein FlgE